MIPQTIRRRRSTALILAACVVLACACGSGSPSRTRGPVNAASETWIDQPISYDSGGVTIYATFRHPKGSFSNLPAALLIAGSGPTDRNGNSNLESGNIDTLKEVADWLSADGVASLRYDKLGSGQTGLGSYASNPDSIGMTPFEDEAADSLKVLAAQKGIDKNKLVVVGHSEGALFALLLARGTPPGAPRVHAVGLLEPLSGRYLDIISVQVQAQVSQQVASGRLTPALASRVDATLASVIAGLRSTGEFPSGLPYGLANLLNASSATFLFQADKYDPAQLAAALPRGTPVLVTCSNADIQVTCGEVEHLVSGLSSSDAKTDFVRLTGVDHVLKVDPSRSPAGYTNPLPFSPQLQSDLAKFVEADLG